MLQWIGKPWPANAPSQSVHRRLYKNPGQGISPMQGFLGEIRPRDPSWGRKYWGWVPQWVALDDSCRIAIGPWANPDDPKLWPAWSSSSATLFWVAVMLLPCHLPWLSARCNRRASLARRHIFVSPGTGCVLGTPFFLEKVDKALSSTGGWKTSQWAQVMNGGQIFSTCLTMSSLLSFSVAFSFCGVQWVSVPQKDTPQETNISPKNGILKMIFLFPRWDMLIPWRVTLFFQTPSTTRVFFFEPARRKAAAKRTFFSNSGPFGAGPDNQERWIFVPKWPLFFSSLKYSRWNIIPLFSGRKKTQ